MSDKWGKWLYQGLLMQMEFIPYASQEAGNPLFQKEG